MFSFEAELWLWQGKGAWHFVSLPTEVADEIADLVPMTAGFGSVRVEVTVGGSTWRTSVFPDAKRGTYILPVKAAIRRVEGVAPGDVLQVRLALPG